MTQVTKKSGVRNARARKLAVRLLVATWEKDPGAVVIDVTPVDLSGGSRCPLCGHKDEEHAG